MTKKKPENEKKKPGVKPFYDNPEEMQKKIDEYFSDCPDKKTIITKSGELVEIPTPTISGLCLYLGFESRQSFYEYEEKPGFTYTVKRARLQIERIYENLLQLGNYSGAIFALKNFGWVDKQEITGSGIAPNVIINRESVNVESIN